LPKKKKSENGTEKIKKRVAAMVKERPSHKDVLNFFKDIITEQYTILSKVKNAPLQINEEDIKEKLLQGFPLTEKRTLKLDIPSAIRLFKRLCKVMSHNNKASKDVERITLALKNKEIDFLKLFKYIDSNGNEYVADMAKKLNVKEDVLTFLIKNSIRPIFEAYANELKNYIDQGKWLKGYCPICGSEPYIAELKNEGGSEGARFLVCSSCNFEWRFNRLNCPFCENGDHKKLRYFYTEKEGRAYRVDVCEKCKRYIKTVDTNEVGEVMPLLEDIGTLHLDVLAQDEGYTKEGITSKRSFS
jgi:FdhE protein